jgi:hypothetical protein
MKELKAFLRRTFDNEKFFAFARGIIMLGLVAFWFWVYIKIHFYFNPR